MNFLLDNKQWQNEDSTWKASPQKETTDIRIPNSAPRFLETNKTSLTKQYGTSQVEPLAELQLFKSAMRGVGRNYPGLSGDETTHSKLQVSWRQGEKLLWKAIGERNKVREDKTKSHPW